MNYQSFLFFCNSTFKKEKTIELHSDYDTNLLYNIFQVHHSKATGKMNNDIKNWQELKKILTDGVSKSVKSDEEIEKEVIGKYNKFFLKSVDV